jgi:hypothetical protein
MALQNPIAVYYAKTNTEAASLCHMLNEAGIEAHLMEDLSSVGFGWGGPMPNVHWPKVWVDKSNEQQAAAILQKYEQSVYDHQPERAAGVGDETIVQAVCEECGEASMFSGRILGTVQECPVCGAFMDVEIADDRTASNEGWEDNEAPENGPQ